MEMFDIYDRYRKPTGRTKPRGEKFLPGEYRIVIRVAIFNENGQMLIQRRTDTKHDWAGMWDISVGGSVQSGENSQQGAQRELSEEIGIDIDFSKLTPALTITTEDVFDDIYILRLSPDITKLKLQETEVAKVKWAAYDDITGMIRSGLFIPYYESSIKLLFDIGFNNRHKSVIRFPDEI
ncbi:MAG: NUDIX domain-containing protein [Ruminococcus sp.]|jgi:isopentenyldiphosphate isomerase|nr:NUDIX domain-containing protein [Ruminococcus sp.]